jgi:hypothetical protein
VPRSRAGFARAGRCADQESELVVERLAWRAARKDAFLVSLDGEDVMLRKLGSFVILFGLLGVSCTRTPSVADANRMLSGDWELALGHDCRDYGIRSDNLALHPDGTFEQHFVSIYDQHYDSDRGHWSYSPDNHINFDSRKNFLTKQPQEGVAGMSVRENLITEFRKPPIILLNPDSDCFYRKVTKD